MGQSIFILKEFEWFEWFEWFGPSPIEPFNSGSDKGYQPDFLHIGPLEADHWKIAIL